MALQPGVGLGLLYNVPPKPLDSLLCLSIHLNLSSSAPWTRHPATSFLAFLFVLLHTAFRTTSFFGIAVSCILSMWPSHHILWHLMNLTMFSPLIMASDSSFRRILHNSFSFTGPYIFRKIFLSNTANALSSSMILSHRWPLDVPMCGISATYCFLIWGCY